MGPDESLLGEGCLEKTRRPRTESEEARCVRVGQKNKAGENEEGWRMNGNGKDVRKMPMEEVRDPRSLLKE